MTIATKTPIWAQPDFVPPLQQGERLTRHEFERRYHAMSQIKKAELIEGIVYMPSPVHHESHGNPHGILMGCLLLYTASTPSVDFSDNATVRLDTDNEVQPDGLLRLKQGASHISADDYIEGAPELIIAIAASSTSYDMHEKLRIYRRNGVREYIVWQVYDRKIDWFVLENGRYVALKTDENGIVHSRTFPGFVLPLSALLYSRAAQEVPFYSCIK